MKLCINCYTENTDDVVFCSKCGMSLMGAPTGEEAMRVAVEAAALEEKRREEAQRLAPQRLTLPASAIVYVFGDQFLTPWDELSALGLAGRFLLAETPFYSWNDDAATPVWLPYGSQSVPAGDLGLRLLEAAFVSLAQEGYISLGVEKTKTLFVSREVVTISRQKEGPDLPPSLERSIMDVLTSAPQERWLKFVVRRLTKVRGSWGPVVNIVAQSLCETSWLQMPKGAFSWPAPQPTEEAAPLLAAMAEEADIVKARLETFAAANAHLHTMLVEDAKAGVRGFFAV